MKKIVKEVNKNSKRTLAIDSVLHAIQKENDLVVGYSEYNPARMASVRQYFLLGFEKEKCVGYYYSWKLVTVNTERPYELKVFSVSQKSKDSILSFIKGIKMWRINHSEKDEIYCPLEKKYSHCIVSDAASNDLILMTKSRQRISDFYAPEYFEYECCPGNVDRQSFLAFKRILQTVFEKTAGKL